jgi:hypothetical protein
MNPQQEDIGKPLVARVSPFEARVSSPVLVGMAVLVISLCTFVLAGLTLYCYRCGSLSLYRTILIELWGFGLFAFVITFRLLLRAFRVIVFSYNGIVISGLGGLTRQRFAWEQLRIELRPGRARVIYLILPNRCEVIVPDDRGFETVFRSVQEVLV